jgi:hypothetical protein
MWLERRCCSHTGFFPERRFNVDVERLVALRNLAFAALLLHFSLETVSDKLTEGTMTADGSVMSCGIPLPPWAIQSPADRFQKPQVLAAGPAGPDTQLVSPICLSRPQCCWPDRFDIIKLSSGFKMSDDGRSTSSDK